MTTIKCPACGAEETSLNDRCPCCGSPINIQSEKQSSSSGEKNIPAAKPIKAKHASLPSPQPIKINPEESSPAQTNTSFPPLLPKELRSSQSGERAAIAQLKAEYLLDNQPPKSTGASANKKNVETAVNKNVFLFFGNSLHINI